MASTLRAQAEGWAEIETDDCGKPIIESRADIAGCVELLEYYAGLAEELGSPGVEAQSDGLIGRVHREPAGVVAAISPWNFPLWQSVAKVAPAIAAGCAVVLKPSERAPLTSLKLGELALEAGLPSGVLNILGGEGFVAGPPLCRHPLVDRVSYTGSGIVGKSIMQIAAERLQFSTMELGGKSSMIVFDDCPDIDAVVDWIMLGIFMCAGQVCSATSRLLVHESIKQAILDKVTAKTRLIRIGDPRLESTNMGPMASKLQRNRVVSYIEGAVKDGIPLIIGGPEPPEGVPADGAFVRPTIFADVPTEAKIWKEEIFGPVLAVRSFSTEEEAVSLANDTEYGLAGAVFTQDQARCERVTARLRCGYVWQNANGATMPGMPFGGFKQSGFGKECGREGLDAYLQSKSVVSAAPGFSWGWYN